MSPNVLERMLAVESAFKAKDAEPSPQPKPQRPVALVARSPAFS